MPSLTTSSDIGAFLAAADKTAAKAELEIAEVPSWFDSAGAGFNPGTAFSLATDIGQDFSVQIGYLADGVTGGYELGFGTAIGFDAHAGNKGVAVGYAAIGQNAGVAIGYICGASNAGVCVGMTSYAAGAGTAVGYGALAPNYGAALGFAARALDGGVAIGAFTDLDPGYFGYVNPGNIAIGGTGEAESHTAAKVPSGLIDTCQIGRGTATVDGGFHYRGFCVVDYNAGVPIVRSGSGYTQRAGFVGITPEGNETLANFPCGLSTYDANTFTFQSVYAGDVYSNCCYSSNYAGPSYTQANFPFGLQLQVAPALSDVDVEGSIQYVNYATSPAVGSVLVDGGSDKCIVCFDGINWIVIAVL